MSEALIKQIHKAMDQRRWKYHPAYSIYSGAGEDGGGYGRELVHGGRSLSGEKKQME